MTGVWAAVVNPGIKWIALFSCWGLLAFPLPAFQGAKALAGKRVYVEPFTTKSGSAPLRDGLIAELRKLSSISLVADASKAEAVLGGGGEIWIEGLPESQPEGSGAV
jgi:hypothetical protein